MMKALIVPQPIANDVMLGQQALIAFPYAPDEGVTEFLMVSGKEPLPEEYSLGLAMGYQLGIVTINQVSKSRDVPGFYEWEVAPKMLVAPKAMDIAPDTFVDVAPTDYEELELETIGLFAWIAEPHADFSEALQAHADALIAIGSKQMPAKYREILARTGSWQEVDAAWEDDQFEHRNHHMLEHGIPEINFGHTHAHDDVPTFKLKSKHYSE